MVFLCGFFSFFCAVFFFFFFSPLRAGIFFPALWGHVTGEEREARTCPNPPPRGEKTCACARSRDSSERAGRGCSPARKTSRDLAAPQRLRRCVLARAARARPPPRPPLPGSRFGDVTSGAVTSPRTRGTEETPALEGKGERAGGKGGGGGGKKRRRPRTAHARGPARTPTTGILRAQGGIPPHPRAPIPAALTSLFSQTLSAILPALSLPSFLHSSIPPLPGRLPAALSAQALAAATPIL